MLWVVQRSRPLVTMNLYPSGLSIKYQTATSLAFTSEFFLKSIPSSQPCYSCLWTSKIRIPSGFQPPIPVSALAVLLSLWIFYVKFNVTSGFLASFSAGFLATNPLTEGLYMDSYDNNDLLLSHFFLEYPYNTSFLVLLLACITSPYQAIMNLNVSKHDIIFKYWTQLRSWEQLTYLSILS